VHRAVGRTSRRSALDTLSAAAHRRVVLGRRDAGRSENRRSRTALHTPATTPDR
jgi:hypothetical protein